MDIPQKRKSNILKNLLDEGTPSGSEDDDLISVTNNDLIDQILRICRKSADGCISCYEIKHLIRSSASSPDSGFRTSSSEEPKYKQSSIIINTEENEFIKSVINDKEGENLKSKKRKRTVEKFSQCKRAKVDLVANQKKNDKIFNALLDDYRSNSPRNSPIVSTGENDSERNSNEKLPIFDLDGNEIIENDKTELPEISQNVNFTKPPKNNRHSMSSINPRPRAHSKRKSLPQPILLNVAKLTAKKCFLQTKSKNKYDSGESVSEETTVQSTVAKSQEKLDINLPEFDLDGNEIIENDKIEHEPEMSQTTQYSLESINTLSLAQPIRLNFETSKKKLESTNLVEFDLDGNEIVQQVDKIKRPKVPQSEKFIKPRAHPYSLRNTLPKAENCNGHPYAMCKQKLDFDEELMQKPKAISKSKNSKIPKKKQTSTTVLPSILLNNNCATEEPARTLYDEDAFIHSAMFDSMFNFEENK